MSDKSVVNVKTPAECLEYLKHITIKLISVGMEPTIGVVTHPATRQWPGGGKEIPGSTRQSRVLPGIISNLEDRIRRFPQVQTMITEFFANNN